MGERPWTRRCRRVHVAGVRGGAVALTCAALGVIAAPAGAVNVQVVNNSGQSPQNVYLMLDGGSSSDGQLPDDTPVKLSAINNSSFSLGTISGGRLYVSYGAPVNNAEPPMSPTRYDKIEFSDPGVANLTAVDFFAIPFDLQSLDGTGATVGDALTYRCYTQTVLQGLRAVAPTAEVDNGNQFVRLLSPQLSPTSYPSMQPYVQSMVGQTITVDDAYFGTPYQTFDYTGTFQPGGSITLNGTITTAGSTVTGKTVYIDGSTLEGTPSAVYTGNEGYTVDGSPETIANNDLYTVVYRDVVAGFGLGYWGGRYGNSTAAWEGQPDFAAARSGLDPFAAYDQYGATIAKYSFAYGYSFHDVGPTAVTVPLNSSVATLQLTIDPDTGPNAPGCVGASTPSAPSAPAAPPGPSNVSTPTTPSVPAVTRTPAVPTAGQGASGQARVAVYTSSAMLDKQGRALMALGCGGDPCKGQLALDYVYKVRVRVRRPPARRGRRAPRPTVRVVTRAIALSATQFAIEEGTSRRIWVTITKAGVAKIRSARGHRLGVLAVATVGPRARPTIAGQRRITLLSYAPPRRQRRRRR